MLPIWQYLQELEFCLYLINELFQKPNNYFKNFNTDRETSGRDKFQIPLFYAIKSIKKWYLEFLFLDFEKLPLLGFNI